jgi:hypothetical protein
MSSPYRGSLPMPAVPANPLGATDPRAGDRDEAVIRQVPPRGRPAAEVEPAAVASSKVRPAAVAEARRPHLADLRPAGPQPPRRARPLGGRRPREEFALPLTAGRQRRAGGLRAKAGRAAVGAPGGRPRAYALKGTRPADPQLRRLADMLTDEMERALDWPIPRSITGGRDVCTTIVMLPREQMPGGLVGLNVFPVLADLATSMAVLDRVVTGPTTSATSGSRTRTPSSRNLTPLLPCT